MTGNISFLVCSLLRRENVSLWRYRGTFSLLKALLKTCQTGGGIWHLIPPGVQGQGGWGREQVEDVPAHCRMGWTKDQFKDQLKQFKDAFKPKLFCDFMCIFWDSRSSSWVHPQHWPDTRMVQEMREGFCFAPADAKFPDAGFLLPWGSESTSLQGEGQQAGVRVRSEGFVLCLCPYISLELNLRLARWIQSVFSIYILFH